MTGQILFSNNAQTTVATALSTDATSLLVAAGSGALFPTVGVNEYFIGTLYDQTGLSREIVRVTATSGDSLTIVRGQEGTTPLSWPVGSNFALLLTAGGLAAVQQLVLQGQVFVTSFMSEAQLADFEAGTALVDQSSAFNAAITSVALLTTGAQPLATIIAPPGIYLISSSILLQSGVSMTGYGAVLVGGITAYPYVVNGSPPAVPLATDAAGQVAGGCFSDANLLAGNNAGIVGVILKGFTVSGFRYGVAAAAFHWILFNAVDLVFTQVNVAFFAYQSIQAWHLENPKCENVNVLLVGDATCFAAGNPVPATWGGDFGSYASQLRIDAQLWQQNTFSNPTFDAWFQAAVIRPSTASLPGFSPFGGTYTYASYATAINVTGRGVYIGGRNKHGNYTVVINQLWVQFAPRGLAFLGTCEWAEVYETGGESMFQDATINGGPPYTEAFVTLAGCQYCRVKTAFPAVTLVPMRPNSWVQALSGPNGYGAYNQVINVQNGATPTAIAVPVVNPPDAFQLIDNEYFTAGNFYSRRRFDGKLAAVPATITYNNVSGSTHYEEQATGGNHEVYLDEATGGTLATAFLAWRLPSSAGLVETVWQGIIPFGENPRASALVGTVEIWLRRMDTGATDYALYPVQFAVNGVFELSLTAAASSGQPTIQVSALPVLASIPPGCPVTIGTDTYVVQSVSTTANTITMTSNLRNAYANGTTLSASTAVGTPIVAFTQSSWTNLGLLVNGAQLRVQSLLGTSVVLEGRMLFKAFGAPLV